MPPMRSEAWFRSALALVFGVDVSAAVLAAITLQCLDCRMTIWCFGGFSISADVRRATAIVPLDATELVRWPYANCGDPRLVDAGRLSVMRLACRLAYVLPLAQMLLSAIRPSTAILNYYPPHSIFAIPRLMFDRDHDEDSAIVHTRIRRHVRTSHDRVSGTSTQPARRLR
jgi:hypothetical protein